MATKRRKSAAATAAPTSSTATSAAPASGIRTIRNGSKIGRPKLQFSVGLSIGKSTVRKGSLRGKILQHLRDKPEPNTASISALEETFGTEKTRGAVQKLMEAGWLKRVTG